jgi:hypothetical protein
VADEHKEWQLRYNNHQDKVDVHFLAKAYVPAIKAYGAALQLNTAHPVLLSNNSTAHLVHGEKSQVLQDVQRCMTAGLS